MSAHPKRMTGQHVIDSNAQEVLRKLLPPHWVLRPYHPDYGIDFSIELFDEVDTDKFDTLGEHLFVQLKGTGAIKEICREWWLPTWLDGLTS